MTVKDLKKALENAPDNMDVFIQQTNDEYSLSWPTFAKVEEVAFVDGSLKANDKVFVISDN